MRATPHISTHNHVSQLTKERIEQWLSRKRADTNRCFVDSAERMIGAVGFTATHGMLPPPQTQPDKMAAVILATRECLELARRATRAAIITGDVAALTSIRQRLTDVATALKLVAPRQGISARLYNDAVACVRETTDAANDAELQRTDGPGHGGMAAGRTA